MPEDRSENSEPFDIERLRVLMELMEKHDVTEVSLRHGEQLWRLRRGPHEVPVMPGSPYPAAPPPPPGPTAAPQPSAEQPAEAGEPAEALAEIKSPTVGTFYEAASPDDPPFVKVGSHVDPDTTVCIVEAMKVFNQIPAEVSGTIVEVLISNGDPVEYGQPLFRVRPD